METGVGLNDYGYLEKKIIVEDVKKMYENQFYQGKTGIETSYYEKYTDQEIKYFKRNAAKKEIILKKFMSLDGQKSFLDIGCGEGYVLNYFYEKGWIVTGIDLSDYGLSIHNPHLINNLKKGDCIEILEELKEEKSVYDVINADLVIECFMDAPNVLKKLKELMSFRGIMIIRVGNYLSPLHKELLKRGVLKEESWFDRLGNVSYFGKDSLKAFLEEMGFCCLEWYGDSFLDFNLMNPVANYYDVKGIGKYCYKAMLDIEDIIEEQSLEKMVELEKTMGDIGLGRHITCICKKRIGKDME